MEMKVQNKLPHVQRYWEQKPRGLPGKRRSLNFPSANSKTAPKPQLEVEPAKMENEERTNKAPRYVQEKLELRRREAFPPSRVPTILFPRLGLARAAKATGNSLVPWIPSSEADDVTDTFRTNESPGRQRRTKSRHVVECFPLYGFSGIGTSAATDHHSTEVSEMLRDTGLHVARRFVGAGRQIWGTWRVGLALCGVVDS